MQLPNGYILLGEAGSEANDLSSGQDALAPQLLRAASEIAARANSCLAYLLNGAIRAQFNAHSTAGAEGRVNAGSLVNEG